MTDPARDSDRSNTWPSHTKNKKWLDHYIPIAKDKPKGTRRQPPVLPLVFRAQRQVEANIKNKTETIAGIPQDGGGKPQPDKAQLGQPEIYHTPNLCMDLVHYRQIYNRPKNGRQKSMHHWTIP